MGNGWKTVRSRASATLRSWTSTAGWSCSGPTTSARSSTTGRGGSGRTRSSGATRRSRSARRSRSPTTTGSSRRTASRRSGSCAGCPRRRCSRGGVAIRPAGGTRAEYRVASITVPIATHVPHAVGYAWGAKLKGRSDCAIAYFGDGATSEGAFHEGANFAAVMRAPAVLLCNNNQWAISTPLSAQTRAETLADKAAGYGMPGVRVDGGDVLAVYEATGRGGGPGARRRRADLHRGGDLPRRAARDRRRPERLHGTRSASSRSARTSAWAASSAICAVPASSPTSWPRRLARMRSVA